MFYRKFLRQGWEVTWRNKYLWFFGLFAALLGNGGEYEIIIRGLSGETGGSFFPTLRNIAGTGVFSLKTLANLPKLIVQDPLNLFFIFFFGIIILILLGFLIWLVIISQAALVNNAALVIGKKKNDFAQGVNTGMKHFWPVLGLNVVIRIVIGISFAILSLPIILMAGRSSIVAANAMFGIAFLLFIPLALAVSFIIKYAIAYVVIKKSSFLDAIKSGWQLFINNWLVSLEMALLLFFINFVVGLALLLFFLVLAVPFLFLALVFHSLASVAGFWLIAMLAFIMFFLMIVIVGAGLATFQISAWTSLFLELVKKGGLSKITRAMDKLR